MDRVKCRCYCEGAGPSWVEARVVSGRKRCFVGRLQSGAGPLARVADWFATFGSPRFSNNQSLWHRAGITAARPLRQRFHSACKLRPSLGSRRSAMKLVVALALPAAALRPVQVTMSAAQNRRAFVIGGTAAAAAAATKANAYSLPDLPYAYDALEPSIDAATMKFHHGACPAYRDVALRESAAPRRRRDPSQTSTTRRMWRASTASSTRRTSRRSRTS